MSAAMKPIYLNLKERLSQTWCNKYTIVMVVMMVKLVLFLNMLSKGFENIQDSIIDNCKTIDKYYSKYADSSPHYMGLMGNFLIEKSMVQIVALALRIISLLVSVSENVITFMIDLWLGTWVCLLVSAIDGSVDVATNATESIIDFVNGTLQNVADDIDDGLTGLTKTINKILSAVNAVKNFFKGDQSESDVNAQVKTVNLTIKGLRTLSIPSSVDEKLLKLSASTPDFATVKNKTKQAIAVPFDLIRKEIRDINSSKLVGDPQYLKVPPINYSNVKVCSDNQEQIDLVFKAIQKVFSVCTIAIILIFVLVSLGFIVYSVWTEWRHWKRLEQYRDQYRHQTAMLCNPFDDRREDEKQTDNVDILETYHLVFHRYKSGIGRWLSRKLSKDREKQANIQWAFSYLTSSTSLTLIALGICGVLTCCLQFIIIAVVSSRINGRQTALMMDSVSASMNSTLQTELQNWSRSTNMYINDTETNVNRQVFGWVQNTTGSVNDTITDLTQDIHHVINKAFNGTILYRPMSTIVQCVIGNKLDAISNAMTWVHEKAQINIPRVDATELYAQLRNSANDTAAATTTESHGTDSLTDQIQSNILKASNKILSQYKSTVVTELVVSLSFLAVFAVQILLAVAFVYMHDRAQRNCRLAATNHHWRDRL